MKKNICTIVTALLLCLILCVQPVAAFSPDVAYTYDLNGEAVPSENVYQAETLIDGTVMGTTELKAAQDLFVDSKDYLYILDSGNMRVLVLDETYRCIAELTEFKYGDTILTLADAAQGIFYHEKSGLLYIADTKNNRIIVSDLNGNVTRVVEKPESEILDPTLPFAPKKVIVDNMGLIYVLSANVNTGALLIDENDKMLGFFGTNQIKATAEILMEYFWRSILTDEQNLQSKYSFQPTELGNLFWSDDRFVYAVSPSSDTLASPVVKLNSVGDNVLPSTAIFGDRTAGSSDGEAAVANKTIFGDITVDSENVFTILDTNTGRLHQYDDYGNLLAIFGGIGGQRGVFQLPSSIEADSKNRILVLDAGKNNITVMKQTFYGEQIRKATALHNDGRYLEAIESWNEIVKMNANYILAYVGLGKAYMKLKEYELAKEYFKLAGDPDNYAEAKEALRGVWIRENFVFIIVILLILAFIILFQDGIKGLADRLKRRLVPAISIRKKGGSRT